jgi:hypothetical protein
MRVRELQAQIRRLIANACSILAEPVTKASGKAQLWVYHDQGDRAGE